MTREEVAKYIKKMDRYKDMEFIRRATVKEIARGLDITSNELKTITKEYLECPWDGLMGIGFPQYRQFMFTNLIVLISIQERKITVNV